MDALPIRGGFTSESDHRIRIAYLWTNMVFRRAYKETRRLCETNEIIHCNLVENTFEIADGIRNMGKQVRLLTLILALFPVFSSLAQEMDEPAAVLFTSVHNPYHAGIAKASCIKPDQVAGSEMETSCDYVFSALRMQGFRGETISQSARRYNRPSLAAPDYRRPCQSRRIRPARPNASRARYPASCGY